MRASNKAELRSLWLKIHKWLGLTLAVPLVLIFLSGSALVWKDAVETFLHPASQIDAAPSAHPSLYVAAATRQLTSGETIASLSYPDGKGPILITVAKEGARQRIRYSLHPSTKVLEPMAPSGRAMGLLHGIHASLLLPWIGGRIVGCIAVLLLFSAFSGLWLWWPVKGPWSRGLRWDRTQSINANIHHQIGFWIALPLVVLSFTAATMAFPQFFSPAFGEAATLRLEWARASASPIANPHLTFEQALAASGFDRGAHFRSANWPTSMDDRWRIDFANASGNHAIGIEDSTGRSGPIKDPESAVRVMERIHIGTEMPFAWQLIIFITGLAGPILGVTGLIIWLRARSREKEMRERRAQRV